MRPPRPKQYLGSNSAYQFIEDQDPGTPPEPLEPTAPPTHIIYSRLENVRKEDDLPMSLGNRWNRWWHLSNVEAYYYLLKDNRVHPFRELGTGFFQIKLTNNRRSMGYWMTLGGIFFFTLFSINVGVFTFTVTLLLIFLYLGVKVLGGQLHEKELIISRSCGYLVRLTGRGRGKVLFEEPLSNIYIKMEKRWDANLRPHYYLIVGGFRIDDIRLTPFDDEYQIMRMLGKAVARRMGLNFFDYLNNSREHKIYNFPGGYTTYRPHFDELDYFLESHGITKKTFFKARDAEKFAPNSVHVPHIILSQIMNNYGMPASMRFEREKLKKISENLGQRKRRLFDRHRRMTYSQSGPLLTKMTTLMNMRNAEDIRVMNVKRWEDDGKRKIYLKEH